LRESAPMLFAPKRVQHLFTRTLAVSLNYGGKSPPILPLPAVSNVRRRRSS